jgi:hypothetical protein
VDSRPLHQQSAPLCEMDSGPLGLIVVVGGSGLRVTGDISRTQGQLLELVSGRERLAWVTVVDPGSSVAVRDKNDQVEYLG